MRDLDHDNKLPDGQDEFAYTSNKVAYDADKSEYDTDDSEYDADGRVYNLNIPEIQEKASSAEETGADPEDPDGEYVVDKTKLEIYDWLQCVVSAIICGIFIFVFIGRTIGVEGDSMRNTLFWHDRVVMSNLFYTPKNGDIVIFRPLTHDFGDTPLVKRVIAIAGQTLDINFDTGDVSVDGVVINEPYIRELTHRKLDFSGPLTIPDGYIFVMGDNRNNSSDSRDERVGMIDTRLIIGKVIFLAVPGGDETHERDWSRFGFVR